MEKRNLGAIILAAGQGTRMRSDRPKVLHPLAGRPMVRHLLATVNALAPDRVAVVVGPGMEDVARAAAPAPTFLQLERLGTAHAVLAARALFENFDGDVLILFGDTPLITVPTIEAMLAARAAKPSPAVVVLGMRAPLPNEYARLVLDASGGLKAIVEYRDADTATRALPLSNSGVMAVAGRRLFAWLDRIGRDNAKGEYYLTDIVRLARAEGQTCAVIEGEMAELLGINSRAELAAAEAVVQQGLRLRAMAAGATLIAPETVFFSHDTRLGRDVTVGPFTHFGPGVSVGDRVEIKGFCHFEQARIAADAIVGPYARLRPGAAIGTGAHIGNFVEIKNADVEAGAKINHLSYVGDARVGANANIGAGTITCNYDGFDKHHTDIGAGAFIGSNTALVAPVAVGDGAYIGAGSTITQDVPADALGIERAQERQVAGWGPKFKARKEAAEGQPKAGPKGTA
ncbi:MAG: bifunctional UDP-N-acetylglucosamine diphosphorylase/glucosamine-1-phosphate N-acetyltransferase GlmU [Alphaproteobacteria bacterium]|nr:bifunctional UDP-N-acetylglucosamine diphosphorylase/glucosamine-1-phosphate N-acetyltransferase GlmU [Alphaproteobacteria bacterium]